MKIESFKIIDDQYLEVVAAETKNVSIFNLVAYKLVISITEPKDEIAMYETGFRFNNIEADFDLTPIVDAWRLANLEK